MTDTFEMKPGHLQQGDLRLLRDGGPTLQLEEAAWAAVEQSAQLVFDVAHGGERVYGINTGFGSLANTSIPNERLRDLQRHIVLSHAAGVGEPLTDHIVRLTLALKINALAQGFSGCRRATIEALIALYNADALPVIPSKGSVGASGDLAPLAHLSCALIGVGEVRLEGETLPADVALERLGMAPLLLEPKEGLALLNGTQVSTALAIDGLLRGAGNLAAATVAGAMCVDASLGADTPFDARISDVRGQPGQIAMARAYRDLLEGSAIRLSHEDCDRVQDPYSLRCQPQVMGACLDHLRFAAGVLLCEANAVTDNPLVFTAQGDVLSGGNFHAEPVAMVSDVIALALAEIGSLSERRIALLTDSRMSQLPPFLVQDSGVNSGFMIAQVTAAALASENKQRAAPASIDSLPTSANQEDHVSMATHAARRLAEMNDNLSDIIAIELLASAQGIDFRKPLETSVPLKNAHELVRGVADFWDQDRLMAPDIAGVTELVRGGAFGAMTPDLVFE